MLDLRLHLRLSDPDINFFLHAKCIKCINEFLKCTFYDKELVLFCLNQVLANHGQWLNLTHHLCL